MNQYIVPAIVSLLLGAIVCFLILPRLSPYILGSLALVMLFLGVWQHYSMFPYEYRMSMVTDLLQQYAGFIMLFAVILASVFGIFTVYGVNLPEVSSVIPEMPAMPLISSTNQAPKNNSKGIFNTSGNNTKNSGNSGMMAAPMAAVTNAFNSAANAVTNVVSGNSKNNSKKNNISSPSFKVV